jgi:hypothetical protein
LTDEEARTMRNVMVGSVQGKDAVEGKLGGGTAATAS